MGKHLAHTMGYDELLGGLNAAISEGLVREVRDGGLSLYCYSNSAVYDQVWTPITTVARGLVLDRDGRRIVATPFPKFFNLGEGGRQAPALDFEAVEKLDGSLIIAFHHDGVWRTATKGAFNSDQAKSAPQHLPLGKMVPGMTYLAELIGPSNKVVVSYQHDECRLLGVYANDGREFMRRELEEMDLGSMALASVFECASLADLVAYTATLPANEEGFVLRFSDGSRLKLKGAEYRRLHSLIARLSPLTVWESMLAGDADAMRREIPEEFWEDFDQIRMLLQADLDRLISAVEAEANKWADASDKDVGLSLKSIPEPARSFIFAWRKGQMETDRVKQSVFREIRPVGNMLNGYVPSFAMSRVAEELTA